MRLSNFIAKASLVVFSKGSKAAYWRILIHLTVLVNFAILDCSTKSASL